MYKNFIRPLLFNIDPEYAHHLAMRSGQLANSVGIIPLIEKNYHLDDNRLEQECFGVKFKNPVGLAAGSDKNCEAQEFFAALGFGFLESVSFAYEAQFGNPKPRVFRLPQDKAIINRLGFPSLGAEALVPRIKSAKISLSAMNTVMGVNFAKSKNVALENAVEDYIKSFRLMKDLVDYIVINVSSPNTPGLRNLQEKSRLNEILSALQSENQNKIPLLVKVAPDITFDELDDIIDCAIQNNLQGIVATNTTKSREGIKTDIKQEGGLSGKPLFPKSIELVKHLRKILSGKLKIIGVGGIFNALDALQMIKAGADLIELYTGIVYEGPSVAYNIKKGILDYLDHNKIENVSFLTGSDD